MLWVLLTTIANAQMLNDSPFNAKVNQPKFKQNKGPRLLIDNAHHNFIVEMGLIKPLEDVLESDGYSTYVDSSLFTKSYLSKFEIVVITPAMPFKFGSKKEITTEITFTNDELVALHEWVTMGGSLLILSEHAPIDKSMTSLLQKFGIQSSTGAVEDSINCDYTVKLPSYSTYLKFNHENGLLNTTHPIITGSKLSERINNIETYTGCSLSGVGYENILKLATTATMKKWNGSSPSELGNSQCLAGKIGKGKVVALGDCNGFTAMYVNNKTGEKLSAGMQVEGYDWKQFVLNTFHWLTK